MRKYIKNQFPNLNLISFEHRIQNVDCPIKVPILWIYCLMSPLETFKLGHKTLLPWLSKMAMQMVFTLQMWFYLNFSICDIINRRPQRQYMYSSVHKPWPWSCFRYNRILSTTNSLPRHISLVMSSPPSMPDGSRADPPPESLQDISLQSLQWLESRGIHSGHHRRSSLSEQMHSNTYQR